MIEILMTLWNQKHTRPILKILFTFFLISVSIFLVILGMPHWSFSKEVNPMTRGKQDASYQVVTAINTPVPTSSVVDAKSSPTVRAQVASYRCALPYARMIKRLPTRTSHAVIVQRRPTPNAGHQFPVMGTQTATMAPVASATIASSPTAIAVASLPTSLSTVTVTTAASAPAAATATIVATGTTATTVSATPTATYQASGARVDGAPIGEDPSLDMSDSGWDFFNSPAALPSPTPAGLLASTKPAPSTRVHYPTTRGRWP